MRLSNIKDNTKDLNGNYLPEDDIAANGLNPRIDRACQAIKKYGNPCDKLYMVGITGTKGKTTTAYILRDILKSWGIRTGIIGTIGITYEGFTKTTVNTTPDAETIHQYCRKMLDDGAEAVIIEVSSQALKQCRTYGIEFDLGIFTNISPDHISPKEHRDFDEYRACKAMLFTQSKTALANGDDKLADEIVRASEKVIKYGTDNSFDYYFDNIKTVINHGMMCVAFELHGKMEEKICVSMPGVYSVYNTVSAIAAAKYINPDGIIDKNIFANESVKGRMQILYSGDFLVVSDYAHNGEALANALTALRFYTKNRLICVFGCGGNRDAARRSDMGKCSGQFADITIITTDNSRFENPEKIMGDIEMGIKDTDGLYIKIPDRTMAIKCACCMANSGDTVLLAGKGHEEYQEMNGVRIPFSEEKIVLEVTRWRKK